MELTVEPVKGVDVGEGKGQPITRQVNGGVVGLMIDARGRRPFILPEDPNEPKDSKLATTGGKEGSEVLMKFLSEVKKFLTAEGKVLLVISNLTGEPEKLFEGFKYECLEKEKLFFEELAVYVLEQ